MSIPSLPNCRTVLTHCPHCQRQQTHHGNDGSTPGTGDFSWCWGCGKVSVYEVDAAGTRLRLPTDEERACIAADPQVAAIRAAATGARTPLGIVERLRG